MFYNILSLIFVQKLLFPISSAVSVVAISVGFIVDIIVRSSVVVVVPAPALVRVGGGRDAGVARVVLVLEPFGGSLVVARAEATLANIAPTPAVVVVAAGGRKRIGMVFIIAFLVVKNRPKCNFAQKLERFKYLLLNKIDLHFNRFFVISCIHLSWLYHENWVNGQTTSDSQMKCTEIKFLQ
jgi:hypothetical protein